MSLAYQDMAIFNPEVELKIRKKAEGKGAEKATIETTLKIALRLIKRDVPVREIAEITDLSEEAIMGLKNEIKK